jgi:hypothetical protein
VRGALCVAGARGRPARRAVRANMQAAGPGLRVLASASRRPARPQRPRHASRVAADPPFALPFGEVFFSCMLYNDVCLSSFKRVPILFRSIDLGCGLCTSSSIFDSTCSFCLLVSPATGGDCVASAGRGLPPGRKIYLLTLSFGWFDTTN